MMAMPKGHKHTDEHRAKIATSMKAYWAIKKAPPLSNQDFDLVRNRLWNEVSKWFGGSK